jgi:predicted alpha/beta hydrolase family esterase
MRGRQIGQYPRRCSSRQWDKIRGNADWIVQLHSPSDRLIPVAEGRFVADQLKSEYMELERRGHFMSQQLPELLRIIKEKCSL